MDGLYEVDRFFPSVVDLSPILDLALSRGYYGLDAAACSVELMAVGGGGGSSFGAQQAGFCEPSC